MIYTSTETQNNTQAVGKRVIGIYIIVIWISMHAFSYFNEYGGKGLLFAVLLDILIIPILIFGFIYLTSNKLKCRVDHWVLLYIILNWFSLYALLIPSSPGNSIASAYGVHQIIFPIFIYLYVRNFQSVIKYDKIIRTIIFINFIYIGIGLYTNYLSPYGAFGGVERFTFYFNSSVNGNICAVSLCALSFLKPNKFLDWSAPFIFSAGVFLTAQRSAIVCSAIALLLLIYVRIRQGHKIQSVFVVLIFLYLAFFTISHGYQFLDRQADATAKYSYNRISHREMLIENAFYQRIDRYQIAMDTIKAYPLGVGVGTTTFDGATYFGTFTSLCDANFMRILVDSGIFGFVSFIGILLSASWLIIKSKTQNAIPGFFVILIYSIQALGTAVFDSIYTGYTFWLLLGFTVNLATACQSEKERIPNKANNKSIA